MRSTTADPCPRPDLHAQLRSYADSILPADRIEALERHLFSCPACVEELEFFNTIPAALRQIPERSHVHRRWPQVAALAASLAAVALVAVVGLSTWRDAPTDAPPRPTTIVLSPVFRGATLTATAPVGRPLELVLPIPEAERDGAIFELRVERASGEILLTLPSLKLAGPNEIRAVLPDGLPVPGHYFIALIEHGRGNEIVEQTRFGLEGVVEPTR